MCHSISVFWVSLVTFIAITSSMLLLSGYLFLCMLSGHLWFCNEGTVHLHSLFLVWYQENKCMCLCSQAAQYGKGFIADLNSDYYVRMCRLLRVLNAVRDHKIGIPLTYTQYPFTVFLTLMLVQGLLRKWQDWQRIPVNSYTTFQNTLTVPDIFILYYFLFAEGMGNLYFLTNSAWSFQYC